MKKKPIKKPSKPVKRKAKEETVGSFQLSLTDGRWCFLETISQLDGCSVHDAVLLCIDRAHHDMCSTINGALARGMALNAKAKAGLS